MDCIASKETINHTFQTISNVSYAEKKEALTTDTEINKLLDDILELNKLLNKKITSIDNINQLLETITWLNNLDEDCLKLLNVLICIGRDFHSTLFHEYMALNNLKNKAIATNAIGNFKDAIDSLIEIIDDLESVFFTLPKMPGFVETTRQLSLL